MAPPSSLPPPPPSSPAPPGSKGNGSNGAGFHNHEPQPEPEPEALPPPPPPVAELVAACMRFVASKYKVALDGTPDTLSLVDQYVREARTARDFNRAASACQAAGSIHGLIW